MVSLKFCLVAMMSCFYAFGAWLVLGTSKILLSESYCVDDVFGQRLQGNFALLQGLDLLMQALLLLMWRGVMLLPDGVVIMGTL